MRLERGTCDPARRAVLATAVAVAGCAPASLARAETPSLTFQGADRLGVYCVLSSIQPNSENVRRSLCDAVAAIAGRNAPVPGTRIEAGDPALLRAGTITLLVQGSLQPAASVVPGADGRLLVFTIRPFRVATDDAVLFGTAPRAVLLPSGAVEGPALEAALAAALSETLPWGPTLSAGPRELSN